MDTTKNYTPEPRWKQAGPHPPQKRKTWTMLDSVVLFALIAAIFNLSPTKIMGQSLRFIKELPIDTAAKFTNVPQDICVTRDGFFLMIDAQSGTVKIFTRNGGFLKFITEFGRNGFGTKRFRQPRNCLYNPGKNLFGIVDGGLRKIFIFKTGQKKCLNGKSQNVNIEQIKEIIYERSDYDFQFWNEDQLVISGFKAPRKRPYDLYMRALSSDKLDYLLPSHQKYNLEDFEAYTTEYKQKQIIPAIGIKAFIDIHGDDLYFVWVGALRIIKINLKSQKKAFFDHEHPNYAKPDAEALRSSYMKQDFKTTWKKREEYSYVKDIFASTGHVFVLYRTGKNKKNKSSKYRLQVYTSEGDCLTNLEVPNEPGGRMWLDKEISDGCYDLYALPKESKNSDGNFSILHYNISVKR